MQSEIILTKNIETMEDILNDLYEDGEDFEIFKDENDYYIIVNNTK